MADTGKRLPVLIIGVILIVLGIAALITAFLYVKSVEDPGPPPATEVEASALRSEREKLVAEKGQMEERIKQLLVEAATLNEKLLSAEEFLAVERKATEPLRQEVTRLKGLYDQALSDAAAIQGEKDTLENARKALETKLANALESGKEASQRVDNLNKEVENLNKRIEELNSALTQKGNDAESLKNRVEELNTALAQRGSETTDLQARSAQQEKALKEAQEKNAQLAATVTEAQNEAALLRKKVAELTTQITTLTARCAELEEEVAKTRAAPTGAGEE